ncbi:MAG: hypothetical protein PVH77_06620 [Phycisphaerales bacterium]
MERPENDKWLDKVLSETIGSEKPRTDFEQWKKNHPQAVEMLTSRAGRDLSASKSPINIRKIIMRNPIAKLAAAAVIIFVVFIGADQFWTNGSSIAWAEVAERFGSVPFFNLTIYIGNDASAETKRIDIWKSEKSKIRVHEGDTVIFADFSDGKSEVVTFDKSSKEPIESHGLAGIFLNVFCKDGQFSLNTLTQSFPGGVRDMTPVKTADTAASKETVVFEAKHESTPERLLIWALRESKLPVRICFSDSRNRERGDFIFDYSEKKDDTFFDPKTFKNQK